MTRSMRTWAFRLLWLLVFTLFWEDDVSVGTASVTRVIGFVATAFGLFAVAASGRMRKPHRVHFAMLAYLLWVIITFFFSIFPEVSFREIFRYAQLVGLAFLVYEFVASEREQTSILQAFVLGSAVSIVGAMTNLAQGNAVITETARFSTAGGPNNLAIFFSASMCSALYLATVRRECAWRWLNICIVPPTLLAVALTGSRGGVIVLPVALLIFPAVVLTRARAKRQILVIGAIAVVTVGALAVVPGETWERLSTTADELRHGDLTGRTDIWRAGLAAFAEHPLTGAGSGTYKREVAPRLGRYIEAHNTFLDILITQGIVGLILFMAILALLFASLKHMPRTERRFWFIMLAIFVVSSLGATLGRSKILWILFGMVASRSVSSMAAHQFRQSWEATIGTRAHKGDRRLLGHRERQDSHTVSEQDQSGSF